MSDAGHRACGGCGLVAGLLKGRSLPRAHAFAAKLAAHVVAQPDAMPPIPAELRLG